jgi:hypothetical protein
MQRFKGTFEVRIENKDYTLRPTFDAMETLCTESGKSERELFEAIQDEKYTVKMIVDIIHAGMMGEYWASNRKSAKLDRRVLGQLIMTQGVTEFVPVCIQFLMFAIVPYDQAKKAVDRMNGLEDEAEDPEPQKKTVG